MYIKLGHAVPSWWVCHILGWCPHGGRGWFSGHPPLRVGIMYIGFGHMVRSWWLGHILVAFPPDTLHWVKVRRSAFLSGSWRRRCVKLQLWVFHRRIKVRPWGLHGFSWLFGNPQIMFPLGHLRRPFTTHFWKYNPYGFQCSWVWKATHGLNSHISKFIRI